MNRPHGDIHDPRLLDFSAPINPLGAPAGVREVIARGVELASRYPTADANELCEAAARFHGVARASVLAGNGSSELIYLVARHFQGRPVRVVTPCFTEYEDACDASGCPRASGAEAVATFTANPTSPAGELQSHESLLALPGVVVVDEAFLPFVAGDPSLASTAASTPRLIVLRSLTKLYAIPGLRAGYLVAHPDTVAQLRKLMPPWSVGSLACAASVRALADTEFAELTRERVAKLRGELEGGLRALGLDPAPSVAPYLLVRVPDAGALCTGLRERGIAVRNCDTYTGLERNRHVRIAVRETHDQARLFRAIAELLR